MKEGSRAAKSLLPDVDALTLVQALPGYEVEYRKWSEYLERESELGRGQKAREIVDYQLTRMLAR